MAQKISPATPNISGKEAANIPCSYYSDLLIHFLMNIGQWCWMDGWMEGRMDGYIVNCSDFGKSLFGEIVKQNSSKLLG